jgi:hypothetical protein
MVMPVAREVGHHVQHLRDHLGIEGRGGLVEEHELGLHAEGPRDGYALLLSARKLPGVLPGLVGDTHPFEVAHGARLGLHPRHPADRHRGQHAVLEHRHVREQVELLEDHACLHADALDGLVVRGELDPVHHDAPFWWVSSPLMQRISVDLPEPEGPQMTTFSPA